MKKLLSFLFAFLFATAMFAAKEVPVIIILGQSNADGSAGIGSWSPSIEGATLAERDVSLGFESFVNNNPDHKMKMWHRNVRCNPQGWTNPIVLDAVELGTPGWRYLSYKTELAKNRSAMNINADNWYGSGADLNQRGIEGGLMLEWGTIKGVESELYVLKLGVQGSNIGSWATVADETNWVYFRDKIAKEAFTDLIKQGKTPVIAGIWWMQGESDKGKTTAYYQNCLSELIEKCSTQLGFNTPPFYIGQIPLTSGSYDANIRKAQQNLITENPGHVFFSLTDGLAFGDIDVHFSYLSYSTIGKNLADAVIANSANWGAFATKVNTWTKTSQTLSRLTDVAVELWNVTPTKTTYEYEVGGVWSPISAITSAGTYPVRANITVGDYTEVLTGATLTVQEIPVTFVDATVAASGDGTSWGKAKKTLAEAIASVPANGEIWLKGSATGIEYPNPGQLTIPSSAAGLYIYGGFEGTETKFTERDAKKNIVIIKQSNTTANATNRVFNIAANNVTIDGVTIKGGKLSGTGVNGGALIVTGQNLHLNHCIVEDNSSMGGTGGLMQIDAAGATVENTIFSSNWSDYCGFIATTGTTIVSNCIFYNNGCQWSGPTISVQAAGVTINVYNSTFLRNVGTKANLGQACAIYSENGTINVYNSAFLGNNDCDAWRNSGTLSMVNCAYEKVTNVTPSGSITITSAKAPEYFANPGFTSIAGKTYAYSDFRNYDFSLKEGSALMNKGDNAATGGALVDLAGTPRIMYDIVDLGAYEYAEVNPKAFTSTATGLEQSAATLNGWYVNLIPAQIGFEYKLATAGWEDAVYVQADAVETPYSVNIDGLTKNTDYIARAVVNDGTTKLYGSEIAFKTALWNTENEIADEAGLTELRTWINAGNTGDGITWKLTNDIALTSWTASIGTPTVSFQGIFDGNGHTISNLSFTATANIRGLFHTLGGKAVVRNLGIESGSINGTFGATGCFSGYMNGTAKIENCYNKANITGTGWEVAGIVGWINGLNPQIINCYNAGNIATAGDGGGILGYTTSSGSVISCYNTGTISNTNNKCGAIVGFLAGGGIITNCYFLNTGKRGADDVYSISKTEAELKNTGIIALLNATQTPKVWGGDSEIPVNGGYPILKWQGGRDVVTITVNANANGTATGTATNWIGSVATATAVPGIGYQFKNWTSDAEGAVEVSTANPYIFTSAKDETLYANFKVLTGVEENEATSIKVFIADNRLVITGAEPSASISVYDTAGKLLVSQRVSDNETYIDINAGDVYIVRVNNQVIKLINRK